MIYEKASPIYFSASLSPSVAQLGFHSAQPTVMAFISLHRITGRCSSGTRWLPWPSYLIVAYLVTCLLTCLLTYLLDCLLDCLLTCSFVFLRTNLLVYLLALLLSNSLTLVLTYSLFLSALCIRPSMAEPEQQRRPRHAACFWAWACTGAVF